MYLSPTVRTMRDDPHPEATVTLLVRPADGTDPDDLAAALSQSGATIHGQTRFDAIEAELPEIAVPHVCEIDGIDAMETTDVTRHDADPTGAGEDVKFDG